MSQLRNVHGTGLLLEDTGLLLRGPSGAGKSLLALALLERWEDRGLPAFLVADDRVDLRDDNGMLVMLAPRNLAGLIELRGRGIVSRPSRDRVRLDLVIDLVPDLIRMVEDAELSTDIAGHTLARSPVPQAGVVDLGHQLALVREAVRASRSMNRG